MLSHIAAGVGTVTTAVLMIFGLYATGKTGGFLFRAFPAMFHQILHPAKTGRTVSPFRAFATSLGGTIGVGNLTGVALAIALGGPGAVFWMWISAFLCMTVKYFEVYIAIKHQPSDETHYAFAPMMYLKKVTESKGFPGFYALLGVFSSLAMGSMIQTNAAQEAATEAFGIPGMVTGILFTAAAALFLSGGIGRITGALEKAVPILGGVFLFIGITVIALRYDRILPAFRSIFTNAFSFSSVSGGFLGSGVVLAFRYGVGNGLFSHEAGLGSAGLAHGACGAKPEEQGFLGMFEVFADTIVISTISALMILTTGVSSSGGGVLEAAESVIGPLGESSVALCLILFAFLSVLSWSCYGETCFVWLCGRKSASIFRVMFLLSPLVAVFAPKESLWEFSEIINGGMMILNLTALIGLREELTQIRKLKWK